MTPQELRALLGPYGIDPIRDRGQHFLLDETVVTDAVAAAELWPGETVLEVGPGPGILTGALLDAGANVVAVDIDRRFMPLLEARFAGRSLRTLLADVQKVPFRDLVGPGAEFSVVTNLPYGITSAFLLRCAREVPAPRAATLLIQKEVADRITAGAGEMNRLAAMLQAFATITKVRAVRPGAFMPPPRVDSAVVHLRRRSDAEIAAFFDGFSVETYERLLQTAFAAPRKQLRNTIVGLCDRVEGGADALLRDVGVPPQARPEELSLEMWKSIAARL